jgi:hypothetical protein
MDLLAGVKPKASAPVSRPAPAPQPKKKDPAPAAGKQAGLGSFFKKS